MSQTRKGKQSAPPPAAAADKQRNPRLPVVLLALAILAAGACWWFKWHHGDAVPARTPTAAADTTQPACLAGNSESHLREARRQMAAPGRRVHSRHPAVAVATAERDVAGEPRDWLSRRLYLILPSAEYFTRSSVHHPHHPGRGGPWPAHRRIPRPPSRRGPTPLGHGSRHRAPSRLGVPATGPPHLCARRTCAFIARPGPMRSLNNQPQVSFDNMTLVWWRANSSGFPVCVDAFSKLFAAIAADTDFEGGWPKSVTTGLRRKLTEETPALTQP